MNIRVGTEIETEIEIETETGVGSWCSGCFLQADSSLQQEQEAIPYPFHLKEGYRDSSGFDSFEYGAEVGVGVASCKLWEVNL